MEWRDDGIAMDADPRHAKLAKCSTATEALAANEDSCEICPDEATTFGSIAADPQCDCRAETLEDQAR